MKQQTQEKRTLPKIGVLALMLEAYEPIFPGIVARQTAYDAMRRGFDSRLIH